MKIIIGILLIALGGYLAFVQKKKLASETLEIQSQDTKTIPEVREALEAMASIDPNYREMVEVKGFAQTNQVVQTPYTGERVAFYIAKTVQLSETTETYTDSSGNRRTRTHKHTDTLSEEASGAPLLLKDNEGNAIVIETDGISQKLDLQKTLDRFENSNSYYGNRPGTRYRQYNITNRGDYRILGYKKIEETFRLNAPLYALGEAYMQGGQIYLGPPKAADMPFIVTTKSEEQLVKGKKNSQNLVFYGGIASAAIGLLVIIANFL